MNVRKIRPTSEDHCVLINVAYGKFEPEVCEIYQKIGKNQGWHFRINGQYEDPDIKSHILYLIAAHKYNKKLEEYKKSEKQIGIESFEVATRNTNRYGFCLKANLENGGEILLGADWAFSWDMISKCKVEQQWEIINEVHTIKYHPLWPCEKKDGRTVNQVRTNKINMYQTLKVLEQCYEKWKKTNDDDSNLIKNKEPLNLNEGLIKAFNDYKGKKEMAIRGLIRAFNAYEDWYRIFKDFNEYIDFFDLKIFEEEINENNVYEKICQEKKPDTNKNQS